MLGWSRFIGALDALDKPNQYVIRDSTLQCPFHDHDIHRLSTQQKQPFRGMNFNRFTKTFFVFGFDQVCYEE